MQCLREKEKEEEKIAEALFTLLGSDTPDVSNILRGSEKNLLLDLVKR